MFISQNQRLFKTQIISNLMHWHSIIFTIFFLFPAKIIKLVQENILRTKNEGMCRWPSKKVVEMPHHPNKIYMPRKYVVYECSDDSACCGTSEKTCVAKTMQDVILWFNVRHVSSLISRYFSNLHVVVVDWHFGPSSKSCFLHLKLKWKRRMNEKEEPNYEMMMNRFMWIMLEKSRMIWKNLEMMTPHEKT